MSSFPFGVELEAAELRIRVALADQSILPRAATGGTARCRLFLEETLAQYAAAPARYSYPIPRLLQEARATAAADDDAPLPALPAA